MVTFEKWIKVLKKSDESSIDEIARNSVTKLLDWSENSIDQELMVRVDMAKVGMVRVCKGLGLLQGVG